MKGLAVKNQSVRDHNIKVVLDCLYEKAHSCLELARAVQISDVAAKNIIKELISLDLIELSKQENEKKTVGGQHVRYRIKRSSGIFVGIDFTQNNDCLYIFDFAGKQLAQKPLSLKHIIQIEEINSVVSELETLIEELNLQERKILSIAIAFVGQVNISDGSFLSSDRFKALRKFSLNDYFQEKFNAPIVMRNNVNIRALGEFSHARNVSEYGSSVYYFVGYGLAASVFNDNVLLFGWKGYNGEVGDLIVSGRGNVNKLCSLGHLINTVQDRLEEISVEGLVKAFHTDDYVKGVVLNSCTYLARSVSFFINTLGSDNIVLGGEVKLFGEEYIARLREQVEKVAPFPVKIVYEGSKNSIVDGMLILCKNQAINDIVANRNK